MVKSIIITPTPPISKLLVWLLWCSLESLHFTDLPQLCSLDSQVTFPFSRPTRFLGLWLRKDMADEKAIEELAMKTQLTSLPRDHPQWKTLRKESLFFRPMGKAADGLHFVSPFSRGRKAFFEARNPTKLDPGHDDFSRAAFVCSCSRFTFLKAPAPNQSAVLCHLHHALGDGLGCLDGIMGGDLNTICWMYFGVWLCNILYYLYIYSRHYFSSHQMTPN